MSAIGSSPNDRSQQTDEVRRVRDTYQARENETAKKQSQTIKRLTETHVAELDDLKDEHSRELDELKNKTRDTLSRRDMKYQKEMEDLRDMHQKALQKIAVDAEDRNTRTESSLKGEVKRVTRTSEEQEKIQRNSYEDQLRAKDAGLEEFTERARLGQQAETARRTDVTNRDTEKRLNAVAGDRDQRLSEKQNNIDELRRAKDLEVKRVDHQRMADNARLMKNSTIAIGREREDNRNSQEMQQDTFTHGMKVLREKYDNDVAKIRSSDERFRDQLGDSIEDRQNNKLHSLEEKNARLEEDQPRQRVKADQQKALELDDVRRAMQNNIDQLENVREQTVAATNKKTQQEIGRINKTNTGVIHETNTFYQDKMAMDSLKGEERLSKINSDHDKVLNQEKTSNQTRFEKLRGFNDMEQGKMRSYFERASESMKENFETSLRDMRDRTKQDQDMLFASFSKQAQENDAKFQQKLADTSVKYERQLAEVQDVHLKELKDQQTVAERQKGELIKKSDMDLKSQAAQFEYRVSKMEDLHKREIEQINRKHEESLANLTKNRQG